MPNKQNAPATLCIRFLSKLLEGKLLFAWEAPKLPQFLPLER